MKAGTAVLSQPDIWDHFCWSAFEKMVKKLDYPSYFDP